MMEGDNMFRRMRASMSMPLASMRDEGDKLVMDIRVSQIDQSDIRLNLAPRSLELSVRSDERRESRQEGMHGAQQSRSLSTRTVSLPVEVIPEKAEARLESGVLHIEVPKAGCEGSRFDEDE